MAATDEAENIERSRLALEELCRAYYQPVYRFIVRKGYSPHDAQDLAQDFFLRLSNRELLRRADPVKGRFRCLVFAALRNVLSDAGDRQRALKRGGDQKFVSLEDWMEEADISGLHSAAQVQPEQHAFDYEWAAQVVRQALARLEESFTTRRRGDEFQELRKFLSLDDNADVYGAAAARLKVPLGTLKSMIHRVRVQYGTLLRDEVAQTLGDPSELEEEVRYLSTILSACADAAPGVTR